MIYVQHICFKFAQIEAHRNPIIVNKRHNGTLKTCRDSEASSDARQYVDQSRVSTSSIFNTKAVKISPLATCRINRPQDFNAAAQRHQSTGLIYQDVKFSRITKVAFNTRRQLATRQLA